MLWNIWATGSNDMGNIAPATQLNSSPIDAASFDEAVSTLQRDPEWAPWIHWNESLGEWTIWACRLFPDEKSAKAIFGF